MKKQSVGGQALIEGVMMQSKDKRAMAVRKSDGEIVIKKNKIKSWINEKNIDKVPFIRGSFILIETMIEGVKSLNFSSDFFLDEEYDAFDRFMKKIFKDKANDVAIWFSIILSLIFCINSLYSISLFSIIVCIIELYKTAPNKYSNKYSSFFKYFIYFCINDTTSYSLF